MKFFLAFVVIRHKINLSATYFKLHLTIIKFPTLEISSESGGLTSVLYNIFEAFMLQSVAVLKLKAICIF